MGLSTELLPVQVVPDDPPALIEYVAARTARTVGKRVEQADAVVLGAVQGVELQPASSGGKLQIARLAVDKVLAGPAQDATLTLAHPKTALSFEAAAREPEVAQGDRGVWFLAAVGTDAHRLADGETGPAPGELSRAVEWYAALPAEAGARRDALAEALQERDEPIGRTAIRALGESGDTAAAAPLEAGLDGASDERRERIAAALWLLGRRDAALSAMEPLLAGDAKDAWLARWGLAYTLDADGRRIAELYGPDASAAAAD
jgi:hypothetical protein